MLITEAKAHQPDLLGYTSSSSDNVSVIHHMKYSHLLQMCSFNELDIPSILSTQSMKLFTFIQSRNESHHEKILCVIFSCHVLNISSCICLSLHDVLIAHSLNTTDGTVNANKNINNAIENIEIRVIEDECTISCLNLTMRSVNSVDMSIIIQITTNKLKPLLIRRLNNGASTYNQSDKTADSKFVENSVKLRDVVVQSSKTTEVTSILFADCKNDVLILASSLSVYIIRVLVDFSSNSISFKFITSFIMKNAISSMTVFDNDRCSDASTSDSKSLHETTDYSNDAVINSFNIFISCWEETPLDEDFCPIYLFKYDALTNSLSSPRSVNMMLLDSLVDRCVIKHMLVLTMTGFSYVLTCAADGLLSLYALQMNTDSQLHDISTLKPVLQSSIDECMDDSDWSAYSEVDRNIVSLSQISQSQSKSSSNMFTCVIKVAVMTSVNVFILQISFTSMENTAVMGSRLKAIDSTLDHISPVSCRTDPTVSEDLGLTVMWDLKEITAPILHENQIEPTSRWPLVIANSNAAENDPQTFDSSAFHFVWIQDVANPSDSSESHNKGVNITGEKQIQNKHFLCIGKVNDSRTRYHSYNRQHVSGVILAMKTYHYDNSLQPFRGYSSSKNNKETLSHFIVLKVLNQQSNVSIHIYDCGFNLIDKFSGSFHANVDSIAEIADCGITRYINPHNLVYYCNCLVEVINYRRNSCCLFVSTSCIVKYIDNRIGESKEIKWDSGHDRSSCLLDECELLPSNLHQDVSLHRNLDSNSVSPLETREDVLMRGTTNRFVKVNKSIYFPSKIELILAASSCELMVISHRTDLLFVGWISDNSHQFTISTRVFEKLNKIWKVRIFNSKVC